jgi:hypothetical protein
MNQRNYEIMKRSILDKYNFRPNRNPGPGDYDTDQGLKHTKSKSYEAFFLGKNSPDKIKNDNSPSPGQYDGHKEFGYNPNNMTIGGKYKWKPDSNPPVGAYDIDVGLN